MKYPLSHKHPRRSILSCQSHVTRGFVGNRAATPLLEVAGFSVDVLLTTLFSSMFVHEGRCLDWGLLEPVVRGLAVALANERGAGHVAADVSALPKAVTAHDYCAVLSGYIGSPDVLAGFAKFVKELKACRGVRWVCDPVLGDNGRLYVSPDMVDAYLTEALPLADVITPNHFELQRLCDREAEFESLSDVVEACTGLLGRFELEAVICTSVPLNGELVLVGAYRCGSSIKSFHEAFKRLDVYYGGTGDVFAATFVLAAEKFGWADVESAARLALQCTQACIKTTMESPGSRVDVNVVGSLMAVLELLNDA